MTAGLRILLLDVHYPPFLERFYAAHAGLEQRPYEEQLETMMGAFFGKGDAYSRFLTARGHETMDVVGNCAELQLRWATERRGSVPSSTRLGRKGRSHALRRIVLAQVEAFDPDVVYVFDLNFLRDGQLRALRRAGRLVVGQIASAAPSDPRLHRFDLIVTSFPHFVERFRDLGVDTEFLRIGFHPAIPGRLAEEGVSVDPRSKRSIPAAFVGSVDPRAHGRGTVALDRLAAEVDLRVWGYGAEHLDPSSALARAHRGQAFGLEMYRVLADAKIVVNRHIDAAEGFANNMRLFEATGSGALLVTEAAPNLGELFEPGREVVTYSSPGELAEVVCHYLENEDERLAIAAAGQRRTFAEHTYDHVIAELDGILSARLQSRRASVP